MKAILDKLPLYMGKKVGMDNVIESLLRGVTIQSMVQLSYFMKIKFKFIHPVSFLKFRTRVESDTHTFNMIYNVGDKLYYGNKINSRYGYPIPINLIESWEPIPKPDREFKSEKEFTKKFDLRFIKEDAIHQLWIKGSSMHNGHFRKSDFRKMGKAGKGVFGNFLKGFKGINLNLLPERDAYRKSPYGEYHVYSEKYYGRGSGRDISISHQTNTDKVYYSSEFVGCGNGRYGLLANKKEYLWLEDD